MAAQRIRSRFPRSFCRITAPSTWRDPCQGSAHCGVSYMKAPSGCWKSRGRWAENVTSEFVAFSDCTQSLSFLVHSNWETGVSRPSSPFSARPSTLLTPVSRGRASRLLQSQLLREKKGLLPSWLWLWCGLGWYVPILICFVWQVESSLSVVFRSRDRDG